MQTSDIAALTMLTPSREGLTAEELAHALQLLGTRWSAGGGDLKLELRGPMTKTGMVAASAGRFADELDHHPRIVLEYAGLHLTIHTHDAKAITAMDLIYAARLEQWLRGNGWPA